MSAQVADARVGCLDAFVASLRGLATAPRTPRPYLAVAAVLLATMMTSFHTRYFSLALADLRGIWGLSFDEGASLNTVANALQLLTAPAIPLAVATFGGRRVLLSCSLAFAFVTFLTPFADGPVLLFTLHGLTAVLLGCFVPATLATVFRHLPPRLWLPALSLYTLRLTFVLHSGVSLESVYVDTLGWQGLYWQSTACGLLVAAMVAGSLPREGFNATLWARSDKGAIALFCVSLTLIYAGLDEGNRLDWFESGEIVALLGGGLLMLLAYLAWQYVTDRPFAHPRVLGRQVLLPMLVGGLYGFLSMASALLIPNFLGTLAHQKSAQSGDVLWLISGLQLVLVPLSVYVIRRIDARLTLAFGILAMMVGCWQGTHVTHEWVGADFVPLAVSFAIGNAFCFLSVMALAVANAQPAHILGVLAFAQIPRVLGPTFASSIVVTLLRKREGAHSANLMPYLDTARPGVAEFLHRADGAVSGLADLVHQQAYVLAYRDVFMFCFFVGLLALIVVAFMRSAPANPLTPSGYRN